MDAARCPSSSSRKPSNDIIRILANECPRATSQKTLPLKHYFFSLELGHLELLPLQMKQNKIKRFIVATQKGFLSANWIGINTYICTHTTTLLWMQVLANYTHT